MKTFYMGKGGGGGGAAPHPFPFTFFLQKCRLSVKKLPLAGGTPYMDYCAPEQGMVFGNCGLEQDVYKLVIFGLGYYPNFILV